MNHYYCGGITIYLNKKNLIVGFVFILLLGGIAQAAITNIQTYKKEKLESSPTIVNTAHNILLTGFWNPTGLMIAPFSTDPILNPDGWKGENWEDLGFNIHSYFPTPGTYTGTFEVDYQDTWNDFWNITEEIQPIAIISFGAGAGPWEIEYNARNLGFWYPDEKAPFQPTPCPPDDTVEVDFIRHATLPLQRIADLVNQETSLDAWVDWSGTPGSYLCEYMAYLGMWYQSLHNESSSSQPCLASGFIHVHASVPVTEAMKAVNCTLRETITYLDTLNDPPTTPDITGPSSGKIATSYTYNVTAYDVNENNLWFIWDWGDGTTSEWMGPFASNTICQATHMWDTEGAFTIKVKARDEWGAESSWATLEISMPKYQQKTILFIERLINYFPVLEEIFF